MQAVLGLFERVEHAVRALQKLLALARDSVAANTVS